MALQIHVADGAAMQALHPCCLMPANSAHSVLCRRNGLAATLHRTMREATLNMRPRPRIAVKRRPYTRTKRGTRVPETVMLWQWKCSGPCDPEWCESWNGWYSSPALAADRGRIHLKLSHDKMKMGIQR